MMKKINGKQKNVLVSVSLLIVALVLVASIYSRLNNNEAQKDALKDMASETGSKVEEIEGSDHTDESIEVPEINVEEITMISDEKAEVVIINVPMPIPPEKPELEAPEVKPVSKDDMENMDKVPEYKKEDLVIVPEEVVVVKQEKETTKPAVEEAKNESKLVPPSENPFLNPANAAKPIELDGSDLGDGEWGTGDKF